MEDRKIGGDEVTTACQGACPTRAIVFGNMADPESSVSKARKSPRHYGLLAELGTRFVSLTARSGGHVVRLDDGTEHVDVSAEDAAARALLACL